MPHKIIAFTFQYLGLTDYIYTNPNIPKVGPDDLPKSFLTWAALWLCTTPPHFPKQNNSIPLGKCFWTHHYCRSSFYCCSEGTCGTCWRLNFESGSQSPAVCQADGPWNCLSHHKAAKVNELLIQSQLWEDKPLITTGLHSTNVN